MRCPPHCPGESRPGFFTYRARYSSGSSCDARCSGTGCSSNGARGACAFTRLRECNRGSDPIQIRNPIVLPQIEKFQFGTLPPKKVDLNIVVGQRWVRPAFKLKGESSCYR